MKYKQPEQRVHRLLRAFPQLFPDVLLLIAYVIVMDALVVTGSLDGPLLALLGIPLVVYVPGYSVLAALFPRHRDGSDSGVFAGVSDEALGTLERTALSFGVSLALLPPIALTVEHTSGGFHQQTILGVLNLLVFVSVTAAALRRLHLYESEEFTWPGSGWSARIVPSSSFGSRLDAAFTIALVAVTVVASVSLATAMVSPNDGESYTNVAMLTESETGDLTTSGYPTELSRGSTASLVIAVDNSEDRPVQYTIVGELQRVNRIDGSVEVVEEVEVSRVSRSVATGESWRANVSVTPSMTGENLRLAYMVYRGDPPDDPRIENAHEHVYLWVDVSER